MNSLVNCSLLFELLLEVGKLLFQARNLLITLRQFSSGKVGDGIAQDDDPLFTAFDDFGEPSLDPR